MVYTLKMAEEIICKHFVPISPFSLNISCIPQQYYKIVENMEMKEDITMK